jgi:hypothetical protein
LWQKNKDRLESIRPLRMIQKCALVYTYLNSYRIFSYSIETAVQSLYLQFTIYI